MSLLEPRCLVCGAPLGRGAPFEKSVRKSEVCSDKCYEIYMYNEDENEQAVEGRKAKDKCFHDCTEDVDGMKVCLDCDAEHL